MIRILALLLILSSSFCFSQSEKENIKLVDSILELVKNRKVGEDATKPEIELIIRLTDNVSKEVDRDLKITAKKNDLSVNDYLNLEGSLDTFIKEIETSTEKQSSLTVQEQILIATKMAAKFYKFMDIEKFKVDYEKLLEDEKFDDFDTAIGDLISETTENLATHLYGDNPYLKNRFSFKLLSKPTWK